MTPTGVPPLTPRAAALRHLAAAGALDHMDTTAPSYPQLDDGWLHLDRSCAHLGATTTTPGAAALVEALDAGQVVLCACTYDRPTDGEVRALIALAHVVTEADRLLADLDADGTWDLQLSRHTQLTAQRDALHALLGEQSLPSGLDRWAADLDRRYDAALAAAADRVRNCVREQLPQRLADQARRRAAGATAASATTIPETPGTSAGATRIVGSSALFGQMSAVQRGVMFAYPSVTDATGFYSRVPAGPSWAAAGDLIDCGPAQPGDTDAVLGAALRLRDGVTEGPMRNPAEALRMARELAAAGQL